MRRPSGVPALRVLRSIRNTPKPPIGRNRGTLLHQQHNMFARQVQGGPDNVVPIAVAQPGWRERAKRW